MNHGEYREPCPAAAVSLRGIAEGTMETSTFWWTREARFRELADRKGSADLHAVHVEVDLPAELAKSMERTSAAIADPSAAPQFVYHLARRTARAGRILLDGEKSVRWTLGGGPSDELARATLQNDFRAEARMAAVGAGKADATTSEQDTLEAWLDLLVQAKSPHWREFGVLEHLAHASMDMSRALASQAFQAEARPKPTVGDTIKRLKKESGYTFDALATAVGIARSQVVKHTKSRAVPRAESLIAYAEAFSNRLGRPVTVQTLLNGE